MQVLRTKAAERRMAAIGTANCNTIRFFSSSLTCVPSFEVAPSYGVPVCIVANPDITPVLG